MNFELDKKPKVGLYISVVISSHCRGMNHCLDKITFNPKSLNTSFNLSVNLSK